MNFKPLLSGNANFDKLDQHDIQLLAGFWKAIKKQNADVVLENADKYTNCLLRLPMFYDLKYKEQSMVINSILENHCPTKSVKIFSETRDSE